MVVLGAVMAALLYVFNALCTVYFFVVLGACLVTWVRADPYNPIVRILHNLTEPALWRIRKYLPFVYKSGLDFSPVVLMIGIEAMRVLVNRLLGPLVV